jgi:flagellar biosynthesis/type III secretory pathway protein FliH
VNDYQYYRGGNYYYTSQYGAQQIQNAINYGYEEGFRAGQADRGDGWDFNYENSYGYQDASYGYDSYYVELDEYNYYFREGFRRGYEDGYNGDYQYGSYSNGKYQILGAVLQTIFSLIR